MTRSFVATKAPRLKQLAALAATAALLMVTPARAQDPAADYPNKPVRLIVANPAGGGVDTVTRVVAEKLHQKLGHPFVVENRGGAGGNLGAEAVFTAAPDGYTLMTSAPSPITANIFLYKKINFDPAKLEPVALLGSYPNTLLVKNDFPAKTAQEFIAYVRANGSKVNYASQGIGTTSHLTAELYNTLMGTKMTHVPYRGTGPALNDIVAGHVDLIFMQLSSAMKLHEGQKARILAVTTAHRLDVLKDVPTMIEAGVPNFVSDTWNALTAPPGTPAPIVLKLNRAINEIMNDADTKKRFEELNVVGTGGSPADLRKLITEETKRWGEVIKQAGIQPE
jgi:tripartite-type tricarboxylate transporter receptor subunit TctC